MDELRQWWLQNRDELKKMGADLPDTYFANQLEGSTFNLAMQARRVVSIPHFPTIDVNNVRTGFFEEKEFRKVCEHLSSDLRGVAEFGYLTGWRVSEILGLRWTQVDFTAGVIRLEVGTQGARYCMEFGGTIKRDDAQRFDAADAPAPSGCVGVD